MGNTGGFLDDGILSFVPQIYGQQQKMFIRGLDCIFFENYLKEGKKIVARQQLSNIYIRNGIFYIFSVKSLIKQKSIYLRKNLFYEIKYKHENIDTLNDLKLCRIIASKLKLNL